MALKDLPKSLVDVVASVVKNSEQSRKVLYDTILSEGLKKFGVKKITNLTESEVKALYAWSQMEFERRLVSESSCGCADTADAMNEDDMPGDAPFHKDGDEDAAKKKELDEEDEESPEVSEEDEVDLAEAMPSSVVKHKQRIYYMKDAEFAQKYAKFTDDELKSLAWSHGYGKNSREYVNKRELGKKELEKSVVKENVAIGSTELATNGAVGVADASVALPKHVDVIKDSSPVTGQTEYRLLVQYATNEGTQIIPPVSLPGAPSVQALRDVVEGLPFYGDAVESALTHASTTAQDEFNHSAIHENDNTESA